MESQPRARGTMAAWSLWAKRWMAVWDWATMPLASNRKILPSPVRATERVDRVNRETPSSFSRERIWWDTVG